MKPLIDLYPWAYLAAVGMSDCVARDQPDQVAPDDSKPEPITLRVRLRNWLARTTAQSRRPDAGECEIYLPEWIGL